MLFGFLYELEYKSTHLENIFVILSICFAFDNQAMATLHATIQAQTMNGALISGSEGYLTIDHVSECNQRLCV
mgnify:CR=1 FL=1